MRTIFIMLSAFGAAILVLNLLNNWQRRRAEQRGETATDRVSVIHLISVVVGFAVFFIGVLFLELKAAPPESVYTPATIKDGTVKSGGFDMLK